MVTYRNAAKGTRKVRMSNGQYVSIEPGETKTIDGARIARGIPGGLIECGPEAEPLQPPPPELAERLSQLDHGDNPGGSEPQTPPALTGLNKAGLVALGQAEGAPISPAMNMAALRAAIEANRS